MSEKEPTPNHIKFVDKRNQKQVDKFFEKEISLMKYLRKVRSKCKKEKFK